MPAEFTNPSYLPALGGGASSVSIPVANASARLALLSLAVIGNVVVQADDDSSWMLKSGGDPAVSGDWLPLSRDAIAAAALAAFVARTDNPHAVTKAQVGLGNVPNLAAADLPLSTAAVAALAAEAAARGSAIGSEAAARDAAISSAVSGLGAGAGGWVVKTADFTAEVGISYRVKGAVVVTDPVAPSTGDLFVVQVITGSAVIGGTSFAPSSMALTRIFDSVDGWSFLDSLVHNGLTFTTAARDYSRVQLSVKPLELASQPLDGEAALTMSNYTVRLTTSTPISYPGGSFAPFSLNYVYQGGALWSAGSGRTLKHDGVRWVARILNSFEGIYYDIYADGAADQDPSTLAFYHAPGSPASGGTFSAINLSGDFAGTVGDAAVLGQSAQYPGGTSECIQESPVRWLHLANTANVINP